MTHSLALHPGAAKGAARHAALDADYAFIRDPARRRLALHAFTPDGVPPPPALRRVRPALQREHIRFWDFPSSPFCIKVRAMLRYKGLQFEAHDPLAPRRWWELQRRGPGKVPALDIDGDFVVDSTDIAWRLDHLFPAQPLLPTNPRALALSHAIEEWCDESIYFVAMHFLWLDPRSRGQVPALFGSNLLGRISYAGYRWLIRRQVKFQGTGRKSPAHIEQDLRRHLDQAAALLADGPFLLGHEPWLCDFALFGQLAALMRARASRDLVRQHPRLVAFIDRMRALGQP